MPTTPVSIVPSVLPADFAHLGEALVALEKAGADRVQWDVMGLEHAVTTLRARAAHAVGGLPGWADGEDGE